MKNRKRKNGASHASQDVKPIVEAIVGMTGQFCNTYKSSHAGGHDPETQGLTPLFNPRTDAWEAHFDWNGPEIIGTTGQSSFGKPPDRRE